MRENIKRLIAVAIAVVLVASACPQVAFAALTAPKDFKNEIDDGNGNVDENSKLKKKIVVSNQKELEEALKTPGEKTIVFDSEEEMKLKIKEKYKGCEDLVINAPQAAVAISASVDKVTINDASKVVVKQAVSTLKINASDLSLKVAASGSVEAIKVLADEAKIQLANQGSVQKISANGTGCDISVQQKGTLEKIAMKNPGKVSVGGSSDQKTEIVVKEGAKGSEISSSVPLALTSKAEVSLELKEGAEKSSVTLKGENAGISLNNQTSEKITITDSNGEKVDVKSKETAGAGVLPSPKEDKKEEKKQQEAAQAGGYSYSDPTPIMREYKEHYGGANETFNSEPYSAIDFTAKKTFDSQERMIKADWYLTLDDLLTVFSAQGASYTREFLIAQMGGEGPYLMSSQEYSYSNGQFTIVEKCYAASIMRMMITQKYVGSGPSDDGKRMIYEEKKEYALDGSLLRITARKETQTGRTVTYVIPADRRYSGQKTEISTEYNDGNSNPIKSTIKIYNSTAESVNKTIVREFTYSPDDTIMNETVRDAGESLIGVNTYYWNPSDFEYRDPDGIFDNWYKREQKSFGNGHIQEETVTIPIGGYTSVEPITKINYYYDADNVLSRTFDKEREYSETTYPQGPDHPVFHWTESSIEKIYDQYGNVKKMTEQKYASGVNSTVNEKTVIDYSYNINPALPNYKKCISKNTYAYHPVGSDDESAKKTIKEEHFEYADDGNISREAVIEHSYNNGWENETSATQTSISYNGQVKVKKIVASYLPCTDTETGLTYFYLTSQYEYSFNSTTNDWNTDPDRSITYSLDSGFTVSPTPASGTPSGSTPTIWLPHLFGENDQ